MDKELADIPCWMVDADTYVIDAEKVFAFIYTGSYSPSIWKDYKSKHQCMANILRMYRPLLGHVYDHCGTQVLSLKGAEYIAMNGVGTMDSPRFAKFFHFVTNWKTTGVPASTNINRATQGVKRVPYEGSADKELANIPSWLVDDSSYVICAETLFGFLYGEGGVGHFNDYVSAHPCMAADYKITKFGPVLGHAYTLFGVPVLTVKGAEYIAVHGVVGTMEYTHFAKFFQFVGKWMQTRIPGTLNINMHAVKAMQEPVPTAPEITKAPTIREVMTATALGNEATLPALFKSLMNEYTEMRRQFSEERDRKDKLIEELTRKIMSV